MKKILSILFLSVLVVSGCTKSSGGADDDKKLIGKGGAGKAHVMEGTWDKCINNPDSSFNIIFEFKPNENFIFKQIQYNSKDCKGNVNFVVTGMGTYKVGGEASNETGVKEVDIELKSNTAEVRDSLYLPKVNRLGIFGHSNWVLNEEKNVLGVGEEGESTSALKFLIVKQEKDKLTISKMVDTKEDRPKTFSGDNGLILNKVQ
jgi:hypothetical protein